MTKNSCPILFFNSSTRLFGSCWHFPRVSATHGLMHCLLISLCLMLVDVDCASTWKCTFLLVEWSSFLPMNSSALSLSSHTKQPLSLLAFLLTSCQVGVGEQEEDVGLCLATEIGHPLHYPWAHLLRSFEGIEVEVICQ